MAFAQGNVTVTQSSAISDVVNGNRSTTNKQQSTATKPQTTTTQKPQTTTTQKPQNTTTKPQTTTQKPQTTTTQKPQNTTTKPQTTTTTQKPQTPVTQTPPPTPQKQNTTGNAETNTQGATTGETTVTVGEGTETEQTEGQSTGGGGGGGTATKPHTYTRQPARPQTNAAATTKMSQEDEILARTKERPVDYSSKSKKIMKGGYKIKGYRLQIFNGGNKGIDKKKAQEAAEKVKKQYPNLPVYVHFYAPRWMTLCGNYRTHKEAEAAQKQFIIAGFKKASIVRQEVIIE